MNAAFLKLVQWLSPSFPTGSFAYSHGLEAAISSGVVCDEASLRLWLSEVLALGSGRQDAIFLAVAFQKDADLGALDALACAMQPSAERLAETQDQGRAFSRTVSAVTGRDLSARCLPIAVAEAASDLDVPLSDVIGLYLHAFTSNLVSIAMRFMPLGQEAGQGVLFALHPMIAAMAAEAETLTLHDLGNAALGADMSSLEHETMDVRIFRT